MGEHMGLWDVDLSRVIRKLQEGGKVKTTTRDGKTVEVRVMRIQPGRFGENELCG